jgi:hypothetical protein
MFKLLANLNNHFESFQCLNFCRTLIITLRAFQGSNFCRPDFSVSDCIFSGVDASVDGADFPPEPNVENQNQKRGTE